jgi:hypothetical protein
LIAVPVLALVVWIASNTSWVDVAIPMPPKGEARVNPFYAAQRFAETLGARTSWDRTLQVPPSNAVIVLSEWHWSLSDVRRQALERWVESGGRLIIDASLADVADFERWSGIGRRYQDAAKVEEDHEKGIVQPRCEELEQRGDSNAAPGTRTYQLCDFNQSSYLLTRNDPVWSLVNRIGIQVTRVGVGRGHVTVVNGWPFVRRAPLEGDHGWLLVAAAELRRGDVIHFLSEADHPSLLALTWDYGAPVVLCAAAIVALGVWRGSARFGPLAPVVDGARRSLAEQIRGTGHFAARHDSGDTLHAACVRALDEAAEKRLPGYRRLAGRERAEALARLTGFDGDALMTAIHHPSLRRDHELAGAIALLEAARRRAHPSSAGIGHGTS